MIIALDSYTMSFNLSVPVRANKTGLISRWILVADIDGSFFKSNLEAAGIERRQASVIVLYWFILCIMNNHS